MKKKRAECLKKLGEVGLESGEYSQQSKRLPIVLMMITEVTYRMTFSL